MSGSIPGDWSGAQDLIPLGAVSTPKTDHAPSIIGYAGSLYCVWIDPNEQALCYSILYVDNIWTATAQIGIPGRTEKALETPALAVFDGYVHAVYPDEQGNLIHMQFDTARRVWGRRSGLAVSSQQAASITAFQSKLFCVYRDETVPADNNLFMLWWTADDGWQKPVQIQGIAESYWHFALFELDANLQLLVADHASSLVKRYVYSGSGGLWSAVDLPAGSPEVCPTSGVSAACVYNIAFLATINKKDNTALTGRLENNAWAKAQLTKFSPAATPSIAVLNNSVYCMWGEIPNGALRWMRRDALNIGGTAEWMTPLSDSKLLTELTIPGAHDAAAVSNALWVGCHTMTFTEQLNAGIRYFDLRAGFSQLYTNDNLIAYHGPYFIRSSVWNPLSEVMIASIFQECYNFLDAHRSEAIIIQIKQDWKANDPVQAARFATKAMDLINANQQYWELGNTIPTLQKLRGKIQLVRRFPQKLPASDGIDMSQGWLDNGADISIMNPTMKIYVQDNYSFFQTVRVSDEKFGIVWAQLIRARSDMDQRGTLYLNFASGTCPDMGYTSWKIALGCPSGTGDGSYEKGVNYQLAAFFNNKAGTARYGVVLMDYPQQPEELILAIIRSNFPGANGGRGQ